ncbi:hypothetical protein GW17_00055529 [Ensete ventricosum]|nr:hypothetical protein GW17_00055529 [Ensete ventricosum]
MLSRLFYGPLSHAPSWVVSRHGSGVGIEAGQRRCRLRKERGDRPLGTTPAARPRDHRPRQGSLLHAKPSRKAIPLNPKHLRKSGAIYYECKLCLTLHNNEGNYLAHTQGKRHQTNLAKRAAREAKDAPAQPQPHKRKVSLRKSGNSHRSHSQIMCSRYSF